MIPWKFFWNNLRLRPSRTLLTILSIAGGVAAVVAVLQSTAATRGELASLHQTLASHVAMEIVATDAAAFPPEDLPSVADVPGVEAAIPIFSVFSKLVADGGDARGITIGVDMQQYRNVRDFEIISGRECVEVNDACVEANVADSLGISVGDEIRLGARGLPWLLKKNVVGILKPLGIGAVEETASVFLTLRAGATLGKAPRKITSLQIILTSDGDHDSVEARIRSLLPSHLILTNSASAADLSRPTEAIITVGLNAAAALSVVAAIFIVVNTFQISVAERQRQLALLRIVGATTDQVRSSMYREAFLLGSVGTIAGILVGVVGSRFLAQGMEDIFGFTSSGAPAIRPHAVLAGLIFGPLVTTISVWFPARTACEAPPLAVLRSAIAPRRGFPVRASLGAGCGGIVIAILLFVCTYFELAEWTALAGLALIVIAGILCLPSLIRPVSACLFGVIKRLYPVEAQLGQQQLLDNFGRTSLTIAVLFVVSATSVSIGNTSLMITGDVQSWLDRTLTADFLLRASRPRVDMSEADALPDDLETHLGLISGIESIDRVSFSVVTVNGTTATLMVRELSSHETVPIDIVEGNPKEIKDAMLAGDAVIGSILARRMKIKLNDSMRMEVDGISQSVRVAGIIKEYTAGGLMVIMDREAAKQVYPIEPAQVFGIRCSPQATLEVGEQLRSISRNQGLIFQSLQDLRDLVRSMINGLMTRLWLILLLALVIAGFAIINTLTMSVIEQTRHLGMLRVVGMSRLQVFRMFIFQALVLSLLALLPGTFVGILLSYLITISFGGVAEYGLAFTLHPALLSCYVISGILLSLLAAALPAIRAGRLKPLEAIHQE
jgi:putative ABC transport system permease protein